MNYDAACAEADRWFETPKINGEAAEPQPVGTNLALKYIKTREEFTVGDAMSDFVEWKRIAAARTYFETTLSLVNHHIIPRLAHVTVEEFDGELFRKFCVSVLESAPKRGNQCQGSKRPLSTLDHDELRKRKKTLNTVIGFLRLALEMAWENGDIASERTWRRIRRVPHADSPRPYFLTRSQAKRLIAACRPDLANLVVAALYTGCRVSELARLQVRDVGCHIFGIYVAPMKSYRGRYVFLPEEGMSFFLDQVEDRQDDDLVFRMASGRSWTGCHKHLFKQAVRKAKLPDEFVFHGLRHTYASQLVQAGTPLAIVARQLGHSNTDTVSRTYGHLSCDSIEAELSARFAPLRQRRKSDARLGTLRDTLQNVSEPAWSWPHSNRSRGDSHIVSLMREREREIRNPDF